MEDRKIDLELADAKDEIRSLKALLIDSQKKWKARFELLVADRDHLLDRCRVLTGQTNPDDYK
jgi:hypothetical protein